MNAAAGVSPSPLSPSVDSRESFPLPPPTGTLERLHFPLTLGRPPRHFAEVLPLLEASGAHHIAGEPHSEVLDRLAGGSVVLVFHLLRGGLVATVEFAVLLLRKGSCNPTFGLI